METSYASFPHRRERRVVLSFAVALLLSLLLQNGWEAYWHIAQDASDLGTRVAWFSALVGLRLVVEASLIPLLVLVVWLLAALAGDEPGRDCMDSFGGTRARSEGDPPAPTVSIRNVGVAAVVGTALFFGLSDWYSWSGLPRF